MRFSIRFITDPSIVERFLFVSSVREKFPLFFFFLRWKSLRKLQRLRETKRNRDGCRYNYSQPRTSSILPRPINVLSTRSSSLPCLDRSTRYANARRINGGRPAFLRDVYEIMLVTDFPPDNRRILCRLNP